MDTVGLIAGNRRFPIVFAEAAKKKHVRVIAVAVKGETSLRLRQYVDKIFWIKLSEFRKMFELFKAEGVRSVVMAGQISPYRLFSKEVTGNKDIQGLLQKIKDKKTNTLFGAIADELKAYGLELLDSTTFIGDLLPRKGLLTKRGPTCEEWENIRFGLELAKEVARLDIGQTVAVKEKAIVAVEAFEGTDNLIRRAGRLVRGNMVVIKVSRPGQDMRFDIPVVGLQTIKTLIKSKATCLAIEADKTLFLDQKESCALAQNYGLSIIAA